MCASVCVYVVCTFVVMLDVVVMFDMVVLQMCIENVTDFLAVCLKATDLLFAIDSESSTGNIFQENGESSLLQKGLQVYQ